MLLSNLSAMFLYRFSRGFNFSPKTQTWLTENSKKEIGDGIKFGGEQ